MSPTVSFVPRRSHERGNADHGWLKTFHTFDFAMYQGSGHSKFGALRVINEDRVAPRTGFGTHSHSEFEIFSYIVAGELEHRDSMGNTEVLKRGDVQLTSAGTGISHSEKCHGGKEVHFLQIWSIPSTRRLQPQYFTRHFSDEEKKDKWVCVVAPSDAPGVLATREGNGPTPVHSQVSLHATLLSPNSSPLAHAIPTSKAYVHVIQTSGYNPSDGTGATVRVSSGAGEDVVLREGDGLYVNIEKKVGEEAVISVRNEGDGVAEILLFDVE